MKNNNEEKVPHKRKQFRILNQDTDWRPPHSRHHDCCSIKVKLKLRIKPLNSCGSSNPMKSRPSFKALKLAYYLGGGEKKIKPDSRELRCGNCPMPFVSEARELIWGRCNKFMSCIAKGQFLCLVFTSSLSFFSDSLRTNWCWLVQGGRTWAKK